MLAPVAARVQEGSPFEHTRPNAVVDEKSCMDGGDINAKRVAAVQSLVHRLGEVEPQEPSSKMTEVTVNTGCEMLDQFQPWYFSIAFAFCFKNVCAISREP